ncbi:MAG: hypothetical protein ACK4IX_14215 [Candidatus Sericytochromatia bacterium]
MRKSLVIALFSMTLALPMSYSFAQDTSSTSLNDSNNEKEFITKMLSLQVLIETYGIDFKYIYLNSIFELFDLVHELKGVSFTKTSKEGQKEKVERSFSMYEFIPDYIDYREYEVNKNKIKSKIIYQPVYNDKNVVNDYKIFYIDSNGKVYEKKNKMFYLSNS